MCRAYRRMTATQDFGDLLTRESDQPELHDLTLPLGKAAQQGVNLAGPFLVQRSLLGRGFHPCNFVHFLDRNGYLAGAPGIDDKVVSNRKKPGSKGPVAK
jgi:hypothetical protein